MAMQSMVLQLSQRMDQPDHEPLMSSVYPHQFTAEVVYHDVGSERYVYSVVYLPEALQEMLSLDGPKAGRLRIVGEINEIPFEAALNPVPGSRVQGATLSRRYYILLSKKMLKSIEAEVGDEIRVRFAVGDSSHVEMPVVLEQALKANKSIQKRWAQLTPGKQRGLAYRVASAKRAETQQKRIKEVFEVLLGKRDARGKTLK